MNQKLRTIALAWLATVLVAQAPLLGHAAPPLQPGTAPPPPVAPPPPIAPPPVSPAPAATPARPAKPLPRATVEQLTARILKETSVVRQLSVLRPVRSGSRSQDSMRQYIKQSMSTPQIRRKYRATEVLIKKLGLAPESFQLQPLLVNLMTEQIAGFYESRTGHFYVTSATNADNVSELEMVMAHELTHALQDQHFNLKRIEKWPEGDSDAEMAAHALVEGDATFTGNRYMMRSPLRFVGMVATSLSISRRAGEFTAAPRFIREAITFPYLQGAVWVAAVHRRGGYAAVSKAFTNMPQSTAQILHPELYFKGVAPVKMDLPDLSHRLGKGWTRLDYDVNGEMGYRQILDHFATDADEAHRVAAGWRGDRYALYEGKRRGEVVLEQVTRWNDAAAAERFLAHYQTRCYARYVQDELEFDQNSSSTTRMAFNSNQGSIVIERRGATVYILEGVKSLPLALRLAGRASWNGAAVPNRRRSR